MFKLGHDYFLHVFQLPDNLKVVRFEGRYVGQILEVVTNIMHERFFGKWVKKQNNIAVIKSHRIHVWYIYWDVHGT